jgi:hypothetical protein
MTLPAFLDQAQDDLRALPTDLRLPTLAGRPLARGRHPLRIVRAHERAMAATKAKRPTTEPGYCLREVRELLSIGPGAPDAITAWEQADDKHRVGRWTNPRRFPPIRPVFWSGGKHGHVGLTAGLHGWVYSTDILRPGYIDRVRIETIADRWGYKLLGITDDLNGVEIAG